MQSEQQREKMIELVVENTGESVAQATEEVDKFKKVLDDLKARRIYPKEEHYAYWLNSIFFNLKPTVISGAQGEGKSRFFSWLILRSRIFQPERIILTNLPLITFDYPELTDYTVPDVYLVKSMSEILYWVVKARREKKLLNILLDEMGSEVNAYNWQSQEAQSWRVLTQFQRHLLIRGPVLAYQFFKSIPNYLRAADLSNAVLGIKQHDGRRYVLGPKTGRKELVVTGEFIPYSSYGSYGFTVDVDMHLLSRRLWGVDANKMIDALEKNLQGCIITEAWIGEPEESPSEKVMKQVAEDEKIQKAKVIGKKLREEGLNDAEISYELTNQFPDDKRFTPIWVYHNIGKPHTQTKKSKRGTN